MVSEQQVDGAAPLAQAIGKQHLPHLQVDAHEDPLDLGIGVAVEDAGVRERVGQRAPGRTPSAGARAGRRTPYAPE